MAVSASDGANRVTTTLRRLLEQGPRWADGRAARAAAAASIAVLAVTGVVALGTTGSAGTPARDAAATTPAAKPHYLLPVAALVQQGDVPPPTLSGDTSTVGVPKGTAARPTAPSTTAPDPSDITTYRGSTGTMTPVGIATLALQRGCSAAEAPTATAVAMAESGGSPSAQGDVTLMTPVWDWSAGLWQIRGLRSERGSGALRDSIANQRATTNAAAMYVISSGCTNWSPWTTYTRGLYLGYLGVARQAVNYVLAYRTAHGHYPAVAAPDPTAVIPVSTGGGAAPAAVPSSTVRTPKPSATRSKAPGAPAGSSTTAGGATKPTSGATSTGKPRSSATPTPPKTSSSKPLLPLPSNILPTSIAPIKILPTCVPILGIKLC